jgi:hypothetical protein
MKSPAKISTPSQPISDQEKKVLDLLAKIFVQTTLKPSNHDR